MIFLIGLAAVAGEGVNGVFDKTEYLKLFHKRAGSPIAASFNDLVIYLIKRLFQQTWIIDLMFVGLTSILLSTMDSYLHAVGVLLVQDIAEPIRAMYGLKVLPSKMKGKYARGGVALVGVLALVVSCTKGNAVLWLNDSFISSFYEYTPIWHKFSLLFP